MTQALRQTAEVPDEPDTDEALKNLKQNAETSVVENHLDAANDEFDNQLESLATEVEAPNSTAQGGGGSSSAIVSDEEDVEVSLEDSATTATETANLISEMSTEELDEKLEEANQGMESLQKIATKYGGNGDDSLSLSQKVKNIQDRYMKLGEEDEYSNTIIGKKMKSMTKKNWFSLAKENFREWRKDERSLWSMFKQSAVDFYVLNQLDEGVEGWNFSRAFLAENEKKKIDPLKAQKQKAEEALNTAKQGAGKVGEGLKVKKEAEKNLSLLTVNLVKNVTYISNLSFDVIKKFIRGEIKGDIGKQMAMTIAPYAAIIKKAAIDDPDLFNRATKKDPRLKTLVGVGDYAKQARGQEFWTRMVSWYVAPGDREEGSLWGELGKTLPGYSLVDTWDLVRGDYEGSFFGQALIAGGGLAMDAMTVAGSIATFGVASPWLIGMKMAGAGALRKIVVGGSQKAALSVSSKIGSRQSAGQFVKAIPPKAKELLLSKKTLAIGTLGATRAGASAIFDYILMKGEGYLFDEIEKYERKLAKEIAMQFQLTQTQKETVSLARSMGVEIIEYEVGDFTSRAREKLHEEVS